VNSSLEQQMHAAVAAEDLDEIDRLSVLLDAEDAAEHARLTAPDALRVAALWYAQQGIPVFPLQPRQKRPLPGSSGFKDATADVHQVHTWWDATPDANIGTPTGLTFDVIDIDGPVGVAALLTELWDELPPVIGWVCTPRAGGNHIYVPPSGRGNKAGLCPGIDYRGTGGYVVLPPSVTDDHGPGRRYCWLRPLGGTG
jgi:hypothetical protein